MALLDAGSGIHHKTGDRFGVRIRPRFARPPSPALWEKGRAPLGVLILTTLASPGHAQSPGAFWCGKSIDLIISSGVGGGYDAYARLIAQHMEKYEPGNPRIAPKNMIGAGGMVATNYIANVAAKNGNVIGQIQNTVPFDWLFGKSGAEFDPLNLN